MLQSRSLAVYVAEAAVAERERLERRQTQASLNRSRSRNFHMTAAMVILFLICWTPYFIGAAIHFADTDFRTGRPRNRIKVSRSSQPYS